MKFENAVKALVAVVGVAGFVFGVIKFLEVQAVEAEKPYLQKKLVWCEEAVETASRIATADTPKPEDVERFWQMYFGVMGFIEKQSITCAMIGYGDLLDSMPRAIKEVAVVEGCPRPQDNLRHQSLALAHACRKELSQEWSPSWAIRR